MPPHILIVDDEPDLVRILEILLKTQGYETAQASDAPTALAMVRERAPDLILLDVMLPGMSGLEMCRLLKAEPGTRGIRVALLTARAEQHELYQEVGAEDCILKPFDVTRLLDRVRGLLST